MTTRDVLYARISEDELGLGKGIDRQLEDGRALAALSGSVVVAEWHDNDISASKGAHRPGYVALLDDVRAERVDRVVVFHTSRLWRNREERAQGIALFAKHRVSIVAAKGPSLDLSTAYGRGLAGLLGEFDTMESEVKSERVQRAAKQRADEGRRNGGVPFGWRVEDGLDVVNEADSVIVREIVDRLLAGESQKALVADLNARGVPSPQGKAWRPSSVRKVALRDSNAARRVHHGAVVGKASWPALVDDDRHDRVVALLTAPERRTMRDGARRHLLTYGVGECGVCGNKLRAVTKRITRKVAKVRTYDNPEGKVVVEHDLYVCDSKGCVGRSRTMVDAFVEAVVVGRLRRIDAAGLVTKDDSAAKAAQDRAEGIRSRLASAADDYAAGLLTRDQLVRITGALRPKLDQAGTEARRHLSLSLGALADAVIGDVEGRWQALSAVRKCQVFDALGMRVRILPTRKGPGFDPESVEVTWSSW